MRERSPEDQIPAGRRTLFLLQPNFQISVA
jgi:hypothetical protein